MITSKDFYEGFQADYFAYKQLRLRNELEEFKKKPPLLSQKIFDYSEIDHLRSIKIDIRQTYFQAIETVFELIFSLKPKNGVIDDEQILQNIIKRKSHYEEIRMFAKEARGLDFLDEDLVLNNETKINCLQYIFFGFLNQELGDKLQGSLLAIRKLLKILALDIYERGEYNSYKHGFRVFTFAKIFSLHHHDTGEEAIKFDISDSISYYSEEEKTGKIEIVTRLFDPERDCKLTIHCNNLISNIIMLRRASYGKNPVTIGVVNFNLETIESSAKHNVKVQDLRFSSTPIAKSKIDKGRP